MSYERKLERLINRRTDAELGIALSEVAKSQGPSGMVKYAYEAMLEVDPRSTKLIKETGLRVEKQLAEAFRSYDDYSISFRYQGSVTNNTHIQTGSDIDLLVVNGNFFTQKDSAYPELGIYSGDPSQEMTNIKKISKSELKSRFWEATVSENPKSLRIEKGSLKKPVDVVPCNLTKGKAYKETGDEVHLGIRILNTDNGQWIENQPFKHNYLLGKKNITSLGRSNSLMRLLKNLKADADINIDVSSYNICALVYNFSDELLWNQFNDHPLAFVERFLAFSRDLEKYSFKRLGILVPVGNRELFGGTDGIKPEELGKLNNELEALLREVKNETSGLIYKTRFPNVYRLLNEVR